jgi:hypothetical protein
MPANEMAHYSDADVGAIVAYIRTLPSVQRATPQPEYPYILKVLGAFGQVPFFPAEFIDHEALRQAMPPVTVTSVALRMATTPGWPAWALTRPDQRSVGTSVATTRTSPRDAGRSNLRITGASRG